MLYPHEWHKPGPIRKRNKAVRKARQRERRREKEREGERRREKEREGERSKEKQREAKRSKEKQREGERRREKEREGERRREKEREAQKERDRERKKNYNRHKLVVLRAPNHLWNLGLCPGSRHQTWTKANWFRVSTGGSQGISGYTMDGNPSRDNGHQQRSVPLTNTMRPTMWEGHW